VRVDLPIVFFFVCLEYLAKTPPEGAFWSRPVCVCL